MAENPRGFIRNETIAKHVGGNLKKHEFIYKRMEYRLIQIIESVDNLTNERIEIFEMATIEYNNSNTEYFYSPSTNNKNHFFILTQEDILKYGFSNKKEKIIFIDLSEFDLFLIKDGNEIKKTFFSKRLSKLRENRDNWNSYAQGSIELGKTVGYIFSHIEEMNLTYGPNYDEDYNDLVPTQYSELEIQEQENYLIIDKVMVQFGFKIQNGISIRINGIITNKEYNEKGGIKKIDTISDYNLSRYKIRYEFDKEPLSPLNKSSRNLIITVFGKNKNDIPIRAQIALFFGRFLGQIDLN